MPRSRLPELEAETYYHADLIGLAVVTLTGEDFGTVRSVQDYGAGELLEIERPDHTTLFLPFNHAAYRYKPAGQGNNLIKRRH
ncbi:MAG TPA: PRC-barrel domain-containing protein [Spirochaetota bacterium]|nr:PRC-barrel domain-containing protein [Spirochaetota bacterium]